MTHYIGPLALEILDIDVSWEGDASGECGFSVSGHLTITEAAALKSLVENPSRRRSWRGQSGVLESCWFTSPVIRSNNGMYLLEKVSFSPNISDFPISKRVQWVGFSLSGFFLGNSRKVVVTRSARTKPSAFSIDPVSVVVHSFTPEPGRSDDFLHSPGGVKFNRGFDNSPWNFRSISGNNESMGFYQASGENGLEDVSEPSLSQLELPRWVTHRNREVTVWDRTTSQRVCGSSHWFENSTDCLVTNGIILFWVGHVGVIPHLNVSAWIDGAWVQVGVVKIGTYPEDSSNVLTRVRLLEVNPEECLLALEIQNTGDCFVSLQRGFKWVEVTHSSPPNAPKAKTLAWQGMPLTQGTPTGILSTSGAFGRSLDLRDGSPVVSPLMWPSSAKSKDFEVALWWLPQASSSTMDDAQILVLKNSSGSVVATLLWSSATKMISLDIGLATVSTPALTFAPNEPIAISWGLFWTNGLSLSTKVGSTTSFNQTLGNYLLSEIFTMSFEHSTGVGWGVGGWGDGAWGGLGVIRARLDNIMVFRRRLTQAEKTELVNSTTPVNGLPAPAGDLVLWAPFDTSPTLTPDGSGVSNGLLQESGYDYLGIKRTIASLDPCSQGSGFSLVSATQPTFRAAVMIAELETYQQASMLQRQFRMSNSQEVRVK